MAAPYLYVALDGASTVLTLAVAVGFLAIARWSRAGLHYLVSAGFTLIAAGFLFVSISHFDMRVGANEAGAFRIVSQLLGSFLLLFAYGSYHRSGKADVVVALLGSLGTAAFLGGIVFWLADVSKSASVTFFALAHGLMALAFLGCTILSGFGWRRRPTWGRAMVPLGFLCWTFSMYTWILIDVGVAGQLLPVVYVWRLAAILLMLWAMVRRPRSPATRSVDATA